MWYDVMLSSKVSWVFSEAWWFRGDINVSWGSVVRYFLALTQTMIPTPDDEYEKLMHLEDIKRRCSVYLAGRLSHERVPVHLLEVIGTNRAVKVGGNGERSQVVSSQAGTRR